jgi:hypothetical protein
MPGQPEEGEHPMPELKPGQVWETRADAKHAWRLVQVINVLGDQVGLQYLDLPGSRICEKTFVVTAKDIADRRKFRLPR